MTTRRIDLLDEWPVVYPHRSRPWTLHRGDEWALLDPEPGLVTQVDPAADDALPGLAPALRSGRLVGYRAGRRAVLSGCRSRDPISASAQHRYIKVVRPTRLRALVSAHTAIDDWPDEVTLPSLLDAQPDGRLTVAAVAGTSLHNLLRAESWSTMLRSIDAIAHSLIGFHHAPSRSDIPVRVSDDPWDLVGMVARCDSERAAQLSPIATLLPTFASGGTQLTHGDLHDKNVIVGGETLLGLIDLDGLAFGYGEDDVANLAVHLQLRSLQAFGDDQLGVMLADRLYAAYQQGVELDRERCRAVEAHTWFRLACLYSFRRASVGLVPELARRAISGSAATRESGLTGVEDR